MEPDFGARPLARLIQREVQEPRARAILKGELAVGGAVLPDAAADGLVLRKRKGQKGASST